MNYRPLGADGEYPAWLRALRGKPGAYVIRERGLFGSSVVYVGESHRNGGNLYGTITRHFQRWRRKKKWFAGVFVPSSTDPGRTYDRGACEVAVVTCAASAAYDRQVELIRKLRPRDNELHQLEDAPF